MTKDFSNRSLVKLFIYVAFSFVFVFSLIACGPGTPTPNSSPDQAAQQTSTAATIFSQLTSTFKTPTPLHSPTVDTIATAIAEGVKLTLTAEASSVPPTTIFTSVPPPTPFPTAVPPPTPYPTYTPYPTPTERPTAVPPPTKKPPSDRVRYWIECDPNGDARIYVFTDPWSWPEIILYSSISGPKGEGPMQGGDIQPKYISPHINKGIDNVDFTLVARFSDKTETHYIKYRYPSGCSPTR